MFLKMAQRTSKSSVSKLTLVFTINVILISFGICARGSNLSNSGSLTHSTARRSDSSSNRFRGLDKVLNRLDSGTSSNTNSKPGSQEPLASPSNSLADSLYKKSSRNQDVRVIPPPTDPKEFDSLDDEDELDDEDSYEDEEDETTGNNDVLADKMSHWGYQYRNRYLASKTTTSTTTSTTTTTPPPPPPPVMSYSQYKWQNYGTRQAIEQSRRQTVGSGGSGSSYNNPGYYGNSHGGSNNHHQNSRHHGHLHSSNNNNNHNGQQQHHHHQHQSNYHHNQQGQHGNYRAQPQTPDTSIREAINHALKVSKEGNCKIPKPRVIRVQDFYPHPGKTYVPHCTILHQCSDDTGCCRHDVLTCSPKTTQRVELSFYVSEPKSLSQQTITVDSSRASTVERFVFYNHTECECRDKMDELMPRDVSYPDPYSPSLSQSSLSHNSLDSLNTSPAGSSQNSLGNPYEPSRNKNLSRCKCPSSFTERVLNDGSCSCDCFDKQHDCLRQKRGRDFFSMQDKWCIQSGRCEIPGCTYGSYIHLAGRCPRKKERIGQSLSWHRYLTR